MTNNIKPLNSKRNFHFSEERASNKDNRGVEKESSVSLKQLLRENQSSWSSK